MRIDQEGRFCRDECPNFPACGYCPKHRRDDPCPFLLEFAGTFAKRPASRLNGTKGRKAARQENQARRNGHTLSGTKPEIRSLPPGFRTPGFRKADAEAAAFLEMCSAGLLTPAELTVCAARLSPNALRIVRWALTELGAAERHIQRERADALSHRTMQNAGSADE